MADTESSVHLKRAYGLIKEAEGSTEDFRQAALRHQASSNNDGEPFVSGMLKLIKGGRQLAADKARIMADLQLALNELAAAENEDPEQEITTSDGTLQVRHLRALAYLEQGLAEALHGTFDRSRQYLGQSIQTLDTANANYWMAVLYENEYDAPRALQFYEKCLQLDPAGEYSVAALRSANEMKNYKPRFRGDWGLFGCFTLFFFPVAIVYYLKNKK